MKKLRIPSSFFASCNNKNFMSIQGQLPYTILLIVHPLPGVTKADTVHSLNLSTAFRYLHTVSRRLYNLLFHPHPTVLAHHILNRIEARIRNHLNNMSVLPPTDAGRLTGRVLRRTRCP